MIRLLASVSDALQGSAPSGPDDTAGSNRCLGK